MISKAKRECEATCYVIKKILLFLGLRIGGEDAKVTVDQENLVETRFEPFQLNDCNCVKNSAELKLKLQSA